MNLYAYFSDRIFAALDALKADGTLPDDVKVQGITAEPPRDPAHGDVATNAAMVLAKQAKMQGRASSMSALRPRSGRVS